MSDWKKAEIQDLEVTKIALVPEGADAEAHIKLFKSKGGEKIMTFEEILKEMKPEHAKVIQEELAKAKDEMPIEKQKAFDQMAEDKKKAEEDKKKAEGALAGMKKEKPNEDDILKGVDPAVKALIEKSRLQAQAAEDAIKKMRADQINKEATSIAKELTSLNADEATITNLYKSLDDANRDTVMDILKKANEAVSKSQLFTEKGSSNEGPSGSDQAWGVIEKEAQSLAEKQGIAKSSAIAEVLKIRPELYANYIKAQEAE